MKYIVKLFIIIHSLGFAQKHVDEIDLLKGRNDNFFVYPNEIYKNKSLWFSEGTDLLFTGRLEIFSDKTKKNKIAECTIINGVKNGYFKQYYYHDRMLGGIAGLYVNNEREGNWTWIEPGEIQTNQKWVNSSSRIVTSIDYSDGVKHGTILAYKTNLIMNDNSTNSPFKISDILLKGEFSNDNRAGIWYFNDQLSTDYDRFYESEYSDQLSMHWTRKEAYEGGNVVQNHCREPWERDMDCDDYFIKYSDIIYLVPSRDINSFTLDSVSDYPITIIKDAYGEDVEVNIINFVEHIDKFHTSPFSRHKELGHLFIVDDNFRNSLMNKIVD